MAEQKNIPYNKLYRQRFSAENYTNPDTYRYTRAGVENALTIIPDAYTSEQFYEIEQERVFGSSWVPVGLASHLSKPGDVRVFDVGGQSIFVTRNKQGALRAFHNVCRHRGAELVENGCEALRSNRIRCPYHSWAYDLDGNCIGTPLFEGSDIPPEMEAAFDMGGIDKFNRADYPLFTVNVDTWAGLIFVNLNDNPQALHHQLGDLVERLAPYRLEEWVPCREFQFVFEANYKLVAENYMEYYHLPWVHPELIKVSRMEDHYRWQGRGMYTGMMTWPVSAGDEGGWLGLPPMSGLDGKYLDSARFIWLFPNVSLSVMPNHMFVMITRPDGPKRTTEDTYILCHPESLLTDSAEKELDQLLEFWRLVNIQDIEIVEKVQRGLRSKAYRGGRMCYQFEEPLHRFQNMVIDKMCGIDRIPEGDSAEVVAMFSAPSS